MLRGTILSGLTGPFGQVLRPRWQDTAIFWSSGYSWYRRPASDPVPCRRSR